MPPRKKKTKEEIEETSLSVKVETLSLALLVDHYTKLRYYYWDGSQVVQGKKKHYIYEMIPGSDARKATRFEDEAGALEYMDQQRNAMYHGLMASLTTLATDDEHEQVTTVDPSVGAVRGTGSTVGTERDVQLSERPA